jgi:mannose-6-phosphate isomerase-like protein (cupin superfamily)
LHRASTCRAPSRSRFITPQVLEATPRRPLIAPLIARPGKGEAIEIFGDTARLILTGEQTGGALFVSQSCDSPGAGPPLHVHEREDELFVIQSGCYEIVLGTERVEAGPGTVVFGPRGLPHTFRVVSDEPGQMMSAALPAGVEGFTRLFARECATGAPNMARITRHAEGFGLAFLSPEDAAHRSAQAARDNITPRMVPPDDGECWEAAGTRARVVLSSHDTNGVVGLVELSTPAGSGGGEQARTHEDAIFVVQAGRYEFHIAGERAEASPGTVVFAPRPHARSFRVVSQEPGRMLVLFEPGGFETSFVRGVGLGLAEAEGAG